MKKRFTRILAALALLVGLTIPMGMWGQTKITDYTNIVSGTSYYIGATSGSTDYYLSVDGSSLSSSIAGTAVTSQSAATPFVFQGSENIWTIQFDDDNGYYLCIKNSKENGKVQVVETAANFVASNQSGKLRLTIQANGQVGSYSIQKNNSGTQFGSYGNTQTDIWLMAVPSGGPTTYTITFDAGEGTFVGNDDFPEEENEVEAGTYTLPSAERSGYTFNGWMATGSTTPQTGTYNVSGDVGFTADYSENSGDTEKATLTATNLSLPTGNSYNDDETEVEVNGITYAYNKLKNDNNGNIQSQANTGNIRNLTAYSGDITSVVITHTGTARATTINGSADGTNWTQVATGSGSITADFSGRGFKYFQITRGANAAYWTKVEITYSTSSSSLEQSGLAITNTSTDLTFDLYPSATTQVINYTTNSTGAITISPASPTSYFSYVHDATAKTITVTPLAVTPSAQTVTISQAGDETHYAGTATFTISVINSNAPGTQNNPYTVAEARAAIDAGTGTQGVYATGTVCRASNSLYNNKYLSYYISADGSTESDQLEAYNGLGIDGANFTSVDDVQVGDIVVIYGNLTKYNTTYEFAANNQLVSLERPQKPSVTVTPAEISVDCGEHTGTLNLQALNLENYSYSITYFEADGETTTMYSWINVTFNGNGTATYNIDANTGAAQFAYFKVRANDLSGNLICYSNLVTVYQAAYEAPFEGGTYMKASSIESGKTYIIVGGEDEDYAMGADRGNNRGAVSVVSDGLTITVEPGQAVYEFVIASIDDLEGYYTIYDPRNNGYLYAAGGTNNNYLKTGASANEDEEGQWAINIDSENSIATIVANFGNEKANTQPRNTMRYNSTNTLFSCYGSDNDMKDIYLYEKVATLTINGYTDVTEGNNNKGYYLIASPVTFDPQYSDMTSGDFDLYYFDQNEELEWINYEDQTDGGFTLVPGKGYLYAKKATYSGETFVFPLLGEAYNESGSIELVYNEEAQFAGWNLIGNPFAEAATLDMPFYRMNEEGSDLEPVDAYNTVNAMEGVFVNAYDQELGSVTSYANFTPAGNTSGKGGMKINLTRNRGTVIDRAIVRFDGGLTLPKFQLNPNNTKIYVTEGNKDYAIVRSAAEAEMPVSFRASENGTYTLAVEAENVEMNYLHLIDNLTGMDVDLLQTPSYTFEAKTSDYASRFRLVFKANGTNENNAETFAYFNGTNWTVSNVGDATLQVVDVTGRTVANQMINGNAELNLNQPAGVYVIRLVNGDNVKTQKVVVR